jgi:hypothetical protein
MQLQAHSACLTTMAAATTLATAGVIFPVLLAVRYDGPAGRTRMLTMISWSAFSSRPASVTSLLDISKVSS